MGEAVCLEFFVNAQQHGGGLSPGGSGIGGKGGGGSALGHAHIIGNGDVSLAGGDIGKWQGIFLFRCCRSAFQAKSPHQHFRHLSAGDGIVWAEGLIKIHHIPFSRCIDGRPINI